MISTTSNPVLKSTRLLLILLVVTATSRVIYSQPQKPTIIVLVRHADVAPSSGDDPLLSAKGQKRAQNLASRLKDSGIQTIFVTEKKRTLQTAGPLSLTQTPNIPLKVRPRGEGGVDKEAKALANGIRMYYKGQKVLVVGHSETLPTIIKTLGGGTISPISTFDNLYVVTIPPGGHVQLLHLKYGDGQ